MFKCQTVLLHLIIPFQFGGKRFKEVLELGREGHVQRGHVRKPRNPQVEMHNVKSRVRQDLPQKRSLPHTVTSSVRLPQVLHVWVTLTRQKGL